MYVYVCIYTFKFQISEGFPHFIEYTSYNFIYGLRLQSFEI